MSVNSDYVSLASFSHQLPKNDPKIFGSLVKNQKFMYCECRYFRVLYVFADLRKWSFSRELKFEFQEKLALQAIIK